MYGSLLAPYLKDPQTLFVVSSDFCHWGTRFRYTHYLPDGDNLQGGYSLSRSSPAPAPPSQPIHQSIRQLDHHGMDKIKFAIRGEGAKTPTEAHDQFSAYLKATKNTICGRHPIGVLLGALASLEQEPGWDRARLEWVRYEQSSECLSLEDSSVSYASAYVCL